MTVQAIKNIIPAVYNALNVTAVTSLLTTYGSGKTLFTGRVVPTNAAKPFIHVRPNAGMTYFDTKTTSGWEYEYEVVIINDEPESTKNLDALIDAVLGKLHNVNISVTSANVVMNECIGMVPAEVSDDLIGTVLRFRITINN